MNKLGRDAAACCCVSVSGLVAGVVKGHSLQPGCDGWAAHLLLAGRRQLRSIIGLPWTQ